MQKKPHLVLVRGGTQALGPISRLGLWNRFPAQSSGHLYFMLGAKILLAVSVAFYLFG